ncbi:short-chain dehydrogenase [Microvirga sp. KLBC 81]|uniref:SDR family NAD(P)-dependent oxidoreductase n=1 Tax=Microvirga sp. KLBC 81 TaxID=1862707 RepID=UPI000D51E0AF|nr:glucose 1-dehydrogenase [Microvirga sp. KLBC 81]PVE22291.1 short-chain dehydrogenase [Microvirga sp. KLBC 81]
MAYNKTELSSRVALVTGGGTGLGKAAAEGLRAAGARVFIMGRREDVLHRAAEDIGAEPVVGDVSDRASVESVVARVLEKGGRLDILVNAAGINLRGESLDYPEDQWDQVHAVNTRGTFLCCQAAGRIMRSAGYGKIINIASLASEIGFPRIVAYASSKGGVRQLTKALAVEWAPFGIRVNGIEPGWFRTELTEPLFHDAEWVKKITSRIPMGYAGKPEDLQGAVVFLASGMSDYITGELIRVDGGALAA